MRSPTPSSCSAAGCASGGGPAPGGKSRSTAAQDLPSRLALGRRRVAVRPWPSDQCESVAARHGTVSPSRHLVNLAIRLSRRHGAGDALRLARACRGVLDVRDRLGDVGGDDLHLGHLLLSHVRGEPDLAQRALLGQHILGVEPGGARGQGERSGGWSGRCARLRARAAGQGAHLPLQGLRHRACTCPRHKLAATAKNDGGASDGAHGALDYPPVYREIHVM